MIKILPLNYEKLLGPPGGLLTWSFLTPNQYNVVIYANVTSYGIFFFFPYTDQETHTYIFINDVILLVGGTT